MSKTFLFRGLAVALLVACPTSLLVGQDEVPLNSTTTLKKDTAPLLTGMGDLDFEATVRGALAKRFLNQGIVLAYGFNHAEAARSFRAVQQADPECAMAYWGEALVLGPNINGKMEDADVPVAWEALQKAKQLASQLTQREQDYIAALSVRYRKEPVADRAELDMAYADAMRVLAKKYPDDYDAQSLFADSLMVTTPWDYWLADGVPKEITKEILSTLERVLARQPNHPLANHLYIHAVEAAHPEWAIASADRLGKLVPGASHLVHMPSHIYIRVGRYADASDANEAAVDVDDVYITLCHAQGAYPLAYMPHNRHFLWFAASMEGRSEVSIEAAQHVGANVDPMMMRMPGMGTLQHFYSMPTYALVRFGRWDEILKLPLPKADLKYPTGVWHFAQGMAHAYSGNPDQADEHLSSLATLAVDPDLDEVTIWENNTTRHILRMAEQVLISEMAAQRKDYDQAIQHARDAVVLEDEMTYEEPQLWYAPIRQRLGATLHAAGKSVEAETVFRADLARYPNNGWSLFGLHKALLAQAKTDEATSVMQKFKAAWRRADVQLTLDVLY